jgi:hypothetical protein
LKGDPARFAKAKTLASPYGELHAAIDDALQDNCGIIVVMDTFYEEGPEDALSLLESVEDIPREILWTEFKTFRRNGETVHCCNGIGILNSVEPGMG